MSRRYLLRGTTLDSVDKRRASPRLASALLVAISSKTFVSFNLHPDLVVLILNLHPAKSMSSIIQDRPSSEEELYYYYGLPSCPRLIARTDPSPWDSTRFRDSRPRLKCLQNVGRHEIIDKWDSTTSLQSEILHVLQNIEWTSIDPVRIGYVDEIPNGLPVVLWIGVAPETLSQTSGRDIALRCKEVLAQNGLSDVRCELRESTVTLQVNRRHPLLDAGPPDYAAASILQSFTGILGESIAPAIAPTIEGTQGLFVSTGQAGEIMSLTCRHVTLPLVHVENRLYKREQRGERAYQMILPGQGTFEKVHQELNIEVKGVEACIQERTTKMKDPSKQAETLAHPKKIVELNKQFLQDINKRKEPRSRSFGEVHFSPPILCAGKELWIQDWSLIKIHSEVFSENPSNTIDLGTDLGPERLDHMLNCHHHSTLRFRFPPDGKLKLHGITPMSEIRSPSVFDPYGNPCLFVGKRGRTTQMTWGYSNEPPSLINMRSVYGANATEPVGQAWSIFPFVSDTRLMEPFQIEPFSATGDSGSAIFDVTGRVGGILFGGSANQVDRYDVTYAMPMEWLRREISRQCGFEIALLD